MMYGYLTPCDGGAPVSLAKPRLVLRFRSQSPDETETASGFAELTFVDGYWNVFRSDDGPRVEINSQPCDDGRLMPDDILTVGRHRYRLSYRVVQTTPDTGPVQASAGRPIATPRPVATPVFGILTPCAGGKAILLRKQKVIIGRSPDCDVVLPLRVVSQRHCELEFLRGYWQAMDLDSHNGTYVNGTRYQMKWIFPGNILGIAVQRFRVEYIPVGEPPSTRDEDIPAVSRKSLMESVGLTEENLDSLLPAKDSDEGVSRRWTIDDV